MAGPSFTLAEIAARVGGEVAGDGSVPIGGVAPLEEAGPGTLSFFANKKYRAAFERCRASAVVVEPDEAPAPGRSLLRVANPYLAFAKASTLFHPARTPVAGIDSRASVHASARVDGSAEVMALASVGAGASVGPRTILFPGVVLGEGVRVGADCIVYPNVVVREGCTVGDRVILQPGCVLGADGFGFAFDPQGEGAGPRHYKVPQAGVVVVEDDVEIGANTCIDRATLGVTRVGRGTKVDNLVQLGHNVEVGPLSIVCGQVGIAGSTKLGMGVVLGGQAGLVGHLHIGDGAKFGAQCGVMHDVEAGAIMGGTPGRPHAEWLKIEAALGKLPELLKRVRQLEKELAKLKGEP
ncbi:MAG: UDP-3-O-(3-hydroxymyristoyl)glucosamine N-acyltransferase [Deltaproteobacteria bacterium]|nr:UDP-3-O-(3-hydroxymyristoyl)glucosamine N-acyltransferase [Deltaproteobacteria bacterium]